MMKICLATLDFIPYRSSGLAIYGENLASGLTSEGHQVTVIASQRKGAKSHEHVGEIEVHRLPIDRTDWIGYGYRAANLLSKLAKREQFDMVHFLDVHFAYAYKGPFIATLFQSFRQRLTSRGWRPYYSSPINLLTRFFYYNLARRWMEPLSLRHANYLIASSQATRDEFITHYRIAPEKIETILLGIDTDRFRPRPTGELRRALGLEEDAQILLFVGFATARKGLDCLAEALHRLDPKVRLLVIGRWEAGYRRQFYRALGDVGERVIELGYVPDADLPTYYSLADLFVLPSLLEGFGLPLVEAMACGTPVIATQVGSIPDVVGEAGHLVPPRDSVALADAVARLLADADLHMKLSRAGQDRATREFTLKQMVTRTVDCYQRLISGRQFPPGQ